jgi:hypothetical protein
MENLDNVLYPEMTKKQQKIFEKNGILLNGKIKRAGCQIGNNINGDSSPTFRR